MMINKIPVAIKDRHADSHCIECDEESLCGSCHQRMTLENVPEDICSHCFGRFPSNESESKYLNNICGCYDQ